MHKDIVKLAVDVSLGRVTNYSVQESNDVLRNAFAELMEFSLEDGSISRQTFRKHKAEIFEILEEIINETLHEGLGGQFDKFTEYRNLKWGDTNKFKVPVRDIFRVALVSDGNGSIRRQRLRDDSEFVVSVDTYAIKIGEDFHRFLAGRVQWADLMKLIGESFKRDLTLRIHDALMASFKSYNSTYHFEGNLDEKKLVETAMHIEARTGEKVAVYGTKLALRELAPATGMITDEMRNQRNQTGYYTTIAGIDLYEIEQAHKYGTDDWAISNKMLLILPQNHDKMIKVINEGDAIIQDQAGGISADMMQEYFIANRFGIAIITSKVFGFVMLP
ncbi:major capsid protein [Bacillus phage vB_BanS-Thrax5]|nr:major capsid protein [Bacillus phage vB_BanS-Thrax5]